MPNLFENDRSYFLGDPELDVIGDRVKLAHEPYLSDHAVAKRYNVSRAAIWRWVKSVPGFPAPIKLTRGTTRWKVSELVKFEGCCAQRDEGNTQVPARTWISGENDVPKLWFANDRILHKWQNYAGRYETKTIDRHLAAIRYFETATDGKAFDQVTVNDVCKVRDDLKRRTQADASDRLSKSSVTHTASHLAAFFTWLLKQDGYRRLPKDLPDYFKLPKAILASALPTQDKAYPSITEAVEMLHGMPSRTLKDQRDRAIFALAFLGGLRADTLVSLRVKHIDISNRLILQDANVVRAKNGKSDRVLWFPIPDIFAQTVVDWLARTGELGMCEDDALFPAQTVLDTSSKLKRAGRPPVPVMRSPHAVTQAFKTAGRDRATNYTPHAAKHTIAAEGGQRQMTDAQRKAWSENLGHENEQITRTHYGKFSTDRRFEVLGTIGDDTSQIPANLTDQEKIEAYDMIAEFLIKKRVTIE